MSFKGRLSFSISMFALMASPAFADERDNDYHRPESADIIVTAPLQRDRMDVLAGTSVLTGAQLTTDRLGRRVEHQRRPCRRDQPAARRADRGAARP
jgi:iron complex outermembrane receptor protein